MSPQVSKPLVLVVDDEEDVRRLLTRALVQAGFRVETVETAAGAVAAAAQHHPAVVILDLMLPDQPGTEVCRQLRADPSLADVAVLMLSARADEYDRVLGFEAGADDYVVKPFGVREVISRVGNLAVRAREREVARRLTDEGRRLSWRGLEVDQARHRVTVDGAERDLRPLEYKLLRTLIEQPGRVFSRTDLLASVWGASGEKSTRTVDTHVRRLRAQLDEYGDAIETVHGFGYRFRDGTNDPSAVGCSKTCVLLSENKCPYR